MRALHKLQPEQDPKSLREEFSVLLAPMERAGVKAVTWGTERSRHTVGYTELSPRRFKDFWT
jgi:hypothetical protein